MILCVVGHAAEKFAPETEEQARAAIRETILRDDPALVISGACPMGGVDVWAIEEAKRLGVSIREFAPTRHRWAGPGGFEARNLEMARDADRVLVVVVRDFPPGFTGKRFPYCYHCKGARPPHVKSGGCWTALKCAGGAEWRIVG